MNRAGRTDWNAFLYFSEKSISKERTDKIWNSYMQNIIYHNSVDVTTFDGYFLQIDCNKAEDRLKITPCSECALNSLAIDELLEYARLALGVFFVINCIYLSFVKIHTHFYFNYINYYGLLIFCCWNVVTHVL